MGYLVLCLFYRWGKEGLGRLSYPKSQHEEAIEPVLEPRSADLPAHIPFLSENTKLYI